jgi:hypothetical protein
LCGRLSTKDKDLRKRGERKKEGQREGEMKEGKKVVGDKGEKLMVVTK